MTFDERNRILAVIEDIIRERTPLSVETGGIGNQFELNDEGDAYEAQVWIRIPKIVVERSR